MAIRLITPPAVEPITLAEAKTHLRVDISDDDALISGLISAARIYCEQWTARAFITQTWELVLDAFPAVASTFSGIPISAGSVTGEIQIPLPPLQQVVSIKYDDANGAEQTLSATDYDVDNVSQPGWVVPAMSGWPTSIFTGINAVRIRYVAGFDMAANVPQSLKSAMLLYIGQLYDQREDVVVGTVINKVPTGGIEHLLRQYRVALGMA